MTWETIVVPIDDSGFSTRAIPAAAAIATAAGAAVTLVSVATDRDAVDSATAELRQARRLVPQDLEVEEEVIVDPDPVAVLLELTADRRAILCVASHDHPPATAALLGSVGSQIIERTRHELLVVGPSVPEVPSGPDVVIAVDGRHDPQALLSAGAAWATRLRAPLRIVTVFEPVLPDVRNPEHFTRTEGPPSNPDAYLKGLATRLEHDAVGSVELVAIPDPVSAAGGLIDHLADRPALVLVAGGRRHPHHPWPGVVRDLVRDGPVPVLVVPNVPDSASPEVEVSS